MLPGLLTVAWRALRRSPAYAALNVAGLAVGLACFLVILLYVRGELAFDRFHPAAERIYRVVDRDDAQSPYALAPTMVADFPEVEQAARLRGTTGVWLMVYGERAFFESRVCWLDSSGLDLFAFRFLRGDPASALRDPFSIVVSRSTARRYFGQRDPLGQVIRADDQWPLKVTGVIEDYPQGSHFHPDFIIPLTGVDAFYGRDRLHSWYYGGNYTYVRLRAGASPAAVAARFPAMLERYVRPAQREGAHDLDPVLQPLTDIHLRSHLPHELEANSDLALVVSLATVALFILLIACINFTNLATARSARRAREVGIRKALGSKRRQLLLQFLGESVLLSLLATVLAGGLAFLALPTVANLAGRALPARELLEPAVIASLLGAGVLAGLVAGAYPAVFLSSFRPATVLEGRLAAGASGGAFRRALVFVQFALSIALVIATGVVYSQVRYVQGKDLGFRQDRVLIVTMTVEVLLERADAFLDELRRRPEVLAATRASSMPGRSGGRGTLWSPRVRREDGDDDEAIPLPALGASEGLETTLGLQLLAGRWIEADRDDELRAVILNETACRAFGWRDPDKAVGRSLQLVGREYQPTIVGVVRDFHFDSLHRPIEPIMINYYPSKFVAVHLGPGSLSAGLAAVESAWHAVYPSYPLDYSFLDADLARLYQSERRMFRLFAFFAGVTVFVAAIGVLGLTAYATEQRRREIGIRKAVGASVGGVVVLLLRELTLLVLGANLLAWPAAYWIMSRWLQGFTYRIALGPAPFVTGALAALAVAWLTVSWLAVRAANANPALALRSE